MKLDWLAGHIPVLPFTCASTAGMLSNIIGMWPATRSFIAGAAPR